MIFLIAGASHTGKTALAQKLLEKYQYPYLSIDHLKMGLIRSGNTSLTPESDDRALTDYRQNLIVEGCYIPFDWSKSFEEDYLPHIKYRCLVMSEGYIRSHYDEIKRYANAIENRLDDTDCTMESLLRDNGEVLRMCREFGAEMLLIDEEYQVNLDW
ncbi:MAG: adenylate kinase [Oscillospiraceae bacterium]|nr:adenylate kinase [Oscillospiraceae bacterium]